jgi:translation initiation factor IF-3
VRGGSSNGGCFLHPPSSRPGRPGTGAGHDERGDDIATDETRINDRIRAREVRLIGENGEQLGIKPLPEALAIARERELDLVEVAPGADPPVCRIMNHSRHEYEQQQRRKESRRKATQVVIKEMKFRPKIDVHDYTTKMRHVERFLGEGHKVKLTIMFRGREMAHPELGLRILERIADEVSDIAIVEAAPRQDGRNMTMVLHPTAKSGSSSSSSGARKRRPSGDGSGSDGPPTAGSEPASAPAPAPEPAPAPAPAPEPVATEPAG